jgi:hypothetical protein
VSDLRAKLAAIDEVDVSESVFKHALGYWVNGKESPTSSPSRSWTSV